MIERNFHPIGRVGNVVFGLAQVGDGLVRILSLGFLHTRFALNVSRRHARICIERSRR